tara:strand:+ start:651 stop:2171 length:1521 start_codon:yes stop_codon:yes gene_type:complete
MSDVKVQMEGIVTPTYDKRRKGYKFKADGMEIFIKGANTDAGKKAAVDQMVNLLEEQKEEKEETKTRVFAEGGLKDEGGTVDPVSGNEVPAGSTKKEVRDDIPAQLSEGEFVFPADVVRYIGLENLMELRQKAKAGLSKMEAMGQMGNSEEATMDDEGAYDDEIDQLIDKFDPNDPETMKFAQGGIVYASNGVYLPGQQFTTGYMPTTGYNPTQSAPPQQTPYVTNPARQAVGQAPISPELRRYVGPNGEILMVPFYDGKPMQGYTIPANYKYQPAEEAVAQAPEIAQPTVQQEDDDDAGREEREAERQAQMARDKEINATLASYDPEFAKVTEKDPLMTGEVASTLGAVSAGVQTYLGRTAAIERIAEKYNIDLDDYKNTGLEGMVSKYDDESFVRDLQAREEDIEDAQDFPPSPSRVPGRVSYDVDEDEPVSTPRGKNITDEVREALAQQRDERSSDDADSEDSGTGTGSASAAGGEDDEAIGSFSKGGVAKQTQRALKSSRKK